MLSILCKQLIIEIKFDVFEFDYLLEIDISSQIQAIWFKVQLRREIGKLDCCDFRDKMFLLPLESLLSQE